MLYYNACPIILYPAILHGPGKRHTDESAPNEYCVTDSECDSVLGEEVEELKVEGYPADLDTPYVGPDSP